MAVTYNLRNEMRETRFYKASSLPDSRAFLPIAIFKSGLGHEPQARLFQSKELPVHYEIR